MSKLSYLSNIGEETIFREYKSFSFQHIGIPMEEEDVAEYLQSFEWNFNSLIEKSLEKYARIYLPRYLTAFLDPKTSCEEDGSLYIGVNDWGIVSGIPYQGELKKEHVFSSTILDYLSEHILSTNGNEYLNRLHIDIIPVTYHKRELPSCHPQMIEYQKKKKELDLKIKQHSQKYMEWHSQNEMYSQKLVDLYQIPKCRANFIRYLRKNGQHEMISKIKNGASIEQQKYDKIKEFLETGNNLYFWLCKWKDEMLVKIRKQKPTRERSYKNIASRLQSIYKPVHILTKTEDLVPWWMQYNEGMNLYVIRYTFKKVNVDPLQDIRFIDYLKKVVKCYRTISDGQPCCLPY